MTDPRGLLRRATPVRGLLRRAAPVRGLLRRAAPVRGLLRRAAPVRALLIAAAVSALVATALLTALVRYATLLPPAGTRAALPDRPAPERSILISGAAGETRADAVARDADIRQRFAAGLAGVPVTVAAGGHTIGQRLPDGFGDTPPAAAGTYASVAFLDDLPAHATLVHGAWPQPVPADQPPQVVLPERAAAALRVAVGDRLPIHDERVDRPAPVQVAGVYRQTDPAEPYWQLASDPATYGPLVVARAEFADRYLRAATLRWTVVPDQARLATADLPAVATAVVNLRRAGIPGPDRGWFPVIGTELDDLATRISTARVVGRSGLLLPLLLVLVITAVVLVLIARWITDQRAAELALRRARGAGRVHLAGLAAGEALLVTVPAAVFGAPAATVLLRLGDIWLGAGGFRLAAGTGGWTVAVTAAAGCAATLILPAARGGRDVATERRERTRPGRRGRVQRGGVDAALVVLAVLAWTQLRRYDGPLIRLAVDPLLVVTPILGVAAATALALRLLPVVTRLGVAATHRRGTFAGVLGLWRADRRPHAGSVLLLILAVAAATLASCVAASWERSQRDQAGQFTGGDLRAVLADGSTARLSTGDVAVPGVRAAMPVARFRADAGHEIIALDAVAAPGVVRLRPDVAPATVFDPLAAGRPAPAGVELPPGARRLTGRVTWTGTTATPGQVTAVLDDGTGVLTDVPLGRPGAAGQVDLDVPVPLSGSPGRARLVALTATASAGAGPGRAGWRFDRLSTVDATGAAVALAVPGGWTVTPAGALAAAPGTVTVTADLPSVPAGTALRYRVGGAGATDPPPVPALATPAMLTRLGARVGDTVPVPQGDDRGFAVRLVGTLAAAPAGTTDAVLLVDLPTLQAYRLVGDRPLDRPTEWWLATDPQRHAAVAATLAGRSELTVVDRVEVARRLLADPLGRGVLLALYAAVLAATALAAVGLAVDARATSLRSAGELAVLHTLGTPTRSLAGGLLVEQAVLAGLGVVSGLAAGLAIAAATAPSLVLTGRGGRPVPDVLLVVPPWQVAVPAVGLLAIAILLGAALARRARRDVAVGLLRLGTDR